MIEKIKTVFWFSRRPNHWAQAVELAVRKFRTNHDKPEDRYEASAWAAERAVPVEEALANIGIPCALNSFPVISPGLLKEGEALAGQSNITMGGPGDINLLHAAAVLSGATKVIETGVAYGWSSLALLAALQGRENAKLVSVDMPYPKRNNEAFVGIVVPEHLRKPWHIIREPDRYGLKKAIDLIGGKIDLCHYDSDKSWWGRQYSYPLLWDALVPGGVFISDDIQDNMAFAQFVEERKIKFSVTRFDGKYVGIGIKE